MFIDNKSKAIRFSGRWMHYDNGNSVTTALGSMFEFAFVGKSAVMNFDIEFSHHPFPHLYVSVDNGVKIEVPIDAVLRIEADADGPHYVKVIFKSSVEGQHRWNQPLEAKLSLLGIDIDAEGELPEDNRKIMEFIGDSITEGVLIEDWRRPIAGNDTFNRPYQDDSTATYAYLTAEAMNYKPLIMGYGAVGITKGGSGAVPKASEAYPYNFAYSPATPSTASVTVINYGANDRGRLEQYIAEYYDFLKLVRSRNKTTKIVVLGAFCGFAAEELAEMVERFNNNENDKVSYISSVGWVPLEPLHPLSDGHKIISQHLIEELKKII